MLAQSCKHGTCHPVSSWNADNIFKRRRAQTICLNCPPGRQIDHALRKSDCRNVYCLSRFRSAEKAEEAFTRLLAFVGFFFARLRFFNELLGELNEALG